MEGSGGPWERVLGALGGQTLCRQHLRVLLSLWFHRLLLLLEVLTFFRSLALPRVGEAGGEEDV